jgi:hypothetical protein
VGYFTIIKADKSKHLLARLLARPVDYSLKVFAWLLIAVLPVSYLYYIIDLLMRG